MQWSSGSSGLDAYTLCKMLTSYGKLYNRQAMRRFGWYCQMSLYWRFCTKGFGSIHSSTADSFGQASRSSSHCRRWWISENCVPCNYACHWAGCAVGKSAAADACSSSRCVWGWCTRHVTALSAARCLRHTLCWCKQRVQRMKPAALLKVPRGLANISKCISKYLCQPIRLFITVGGEIKSMEETSQGDPYAMTLYAVTTISLIRKLQESNANVKQAWYAEDDAAGGAIRDLFHYWTDIQDIEPCMGTSPTRRKWPSSSNQSMSLRLGVSLRTQALWSEQIATITWVVLWKMMTSLVPMRITS